MNYAVIFTHSFDHDVAVYLFKEEYEAINFLRSSVKEEVRIEAEENGLDISAYITDDGLYAKIYCDSNGGDEPVDITEVRVGRIYQ